MRPQGEIPGRFYFMSRERSEWGMKGDRRGDKGRAGPRRTGDVQGGSSVAAEQDRLAVVAAVPGQGGGVL